ncbi:hypothetical protein BTUL_0019g00730 [Botrytis tulipae]|uniref:Uncharacterized protein n=1 Tax=Botrytis tulipae TaxID=87230 RepID=A0A4Z1F3B8_9HELO|nr:hypothetical protein BTUL_0019g00730 [Botrytis tulipae]
MWRGAEENSCGWTALDIGSPHLRFSFYRADFWSMGSSQSSNGNVLYDLTAYGGGIIVLNGSGNRTLN